MVSLHIINKVVFHRCLHASPVSHNIRHSKDLEYVVIFLKQPCNLSKKEKQRRRGLLKTLLLQRSCNTKLSGLAEARQAAFGKMTTLDWVPHSPATEDHPFLGLVSQTNQSKKTNN